MIFIRNFQNGIATDELMEVFLGDYPVRKKFVELLLPQPRSSRSGKMVRIICPEINACSTFCFSAGVIPELEDQTDLLGFPTCLAAESGFERGEITPRRNVPSF